MPHVYRGAKIVDTKSGLISIPVTVTDDARQDWRREGLESETSSDSPSCLGHKAGARLTELTFTKYPEINNKIGRRLLELSSISCKPLEII
jgi:hypothetical protein